MKHRVCVRDALGWEKDMDRVDRLKYRRRGAAAVEFALVLPLFLILLSGVWEVGRMTEVQQILSNAAREGGRQASTSLTTNANVQQVVLLYLQNAFNDNDPTGNTGRQRTQNVVTTVSDLTHPSTDATNATQLDKFQITVTIPFRDVRWLKLPLVTSDATILTGQATWNSMKDRAYPSTITPPLGN
jgi:Flp pilus assembly protein TadG